MRYLACLLVILYMETLSAINIEISTYNFYGKQPFSELYLRVDGSSVEWQEAGSNKSASLNILLIITKTDGSIAGYDKFELKAFSNGGFSDFLEVKRFILEQGAYTIKLEVDDVNKPSNKLEMEQRLIVDKTTDDLHISDIFLLGSIKKDSSIAALVKNGYYMEPLSYHFSGSSHQQMDFYVEFYQEESQADELFIQTSIIEGHTKDVNAKILMSKYKKLNKSITQPEVISLPVNALRSGSYQLLVNVINKDKEILATRQTDFTKSNPEADMTYLENFNQTAEHSFVQDIKADDMDYILKAHLPITDQHQVSTLGELMKSNKIKSQRQFIYQLWNSKAPSNPGDAFKAYMDVANAVDKKFYTNVGYGFQSDRGHIFLKYGKPSNVLTVDTEVDAPPYEIWYYNNMPQTRQTNVRFLFYNPSLAHNDFKLLHSTCLGEKVFQAWEVELYKSVPMERQGNTVDSTQVGENWNRNARRYFNEY